MSEMAAAADCRKTSKAPSMGTFERFLTLWVALCIIVGIGLGQAMPGVFHALGAATVAEVNLPVAVLVWLMIVPMLLKIDPAALGQVGNHWRGIAATVGVNWLVKPFSMALLGWLFIAHLFRPFLPADQIDGYIVGLICWRRLPARPWYSSGRTSWTASRRCHRSRSTTRSWWWPSPACGAAVRPVLDHRTLEHALAVGRALYRGAGDRGATLAAHAADARRADGACPNASRLGTLSLSALLLTLVLLFGLQGEQIMRQPVVIALLAVPILVQVYFNAGLAYWLNRQLGVEWCVAGPSALIGASNFFELAVATAIALFGFQSGAALSTVVGVLVEVPVMLSVVHLVRRSRGWYEQVAPAAHT